MENAKIEKGYWWAHHLEEDEPEIVYVTTYPHTGIVVEKIG